MPRAESFARAAAVAADGAVAEHHAGDRRNIPELADEHDRRRADQPADERAEDAAANVFGRFGLNALVLIRFAAELRKERRRDKLRHAARHAADRFADGVGDLAAVFVAVFMQEREKLRQERVDLPLHSFSPQRRGGGKR